MRGCVCVKGLALAVFGSWSFAWDGCSAFHVLEAYLTFACSISLWCSALVWCYTTSQCGTGSIGTGFTITCCLSVFLCLWLTKEHKEATCDSSGTGSRRCAENSQLSSWLVVCTHICICFATKKWRLGRHLYFGRLLSQRQVMTSASFQKEK